MERITLRIGYKNPKQISDIDTQGYAAHTERHVTFLQTALGISRIRAAQIARLLVDLAEFQPHQDPCIRVRLNHEQLGRYVALRASEKVTKYFWVWPDIEEYVPHDKDEAADVLELRPGLREVPKR